MNIIYVNEKSLRVKSYRTEQIEQSINLPALGEFEMKDTGEMIFLLYTFMGGQ